MNDEIKEILDILKTDMIHIRLFKEDREELLNYITNLQNENKKIAQQHIYTLDKLMEEQTKNENAIEYIKEHISYERGEYGFYRHHLYNNFSKKDLLKILQGGDE